ncbi:MAG: hypothetical protein GX038_05405 [Erysipelothrix sp.]|nr:hypothetical protein [Erysipelothrix sp.]
MKYYDGSVIKEEDIVAIFPRRIEIGENYEIWQHPYFKNGVLAEDFDFQLIYFIDRKNVESYHITQDKERLTDANHLSRFQLLFHDVCENFHEENILVEDIWSGEAFSIIRKIIKEKSKNNQNKPNRSKSE